MILKQNDHDRMTVTNLIVDLSESELLPSISDRHWRSAAKLSHPSLFLQIDIINCVLQPRNVGYFVRILPSSVPVPYSVMVAFQLTLQLIVLVRTIVLTDYLLATVRHHVDNLFRCRYCFHCLPRQQQLLWGCLYCSLGQELSVPERPMEQYEVPVGNFDQTRRMMLHPVLQ